MFVFRQRLQRLDVMRYGTAFVVVMVAVTLSSLNGLFIRSLSDMTDWQMVFWRHFLIGCTLCLGLVIYYRLRVIEIFLRLGIVGFAGAAVFGLSTSLLTLALHKAPIADVMLVLAAVPLLTALLAWIFLREAIQWVTWVAMIGAIVGIAVMVVGSLGGGTIVGTILSIAAAVMVAIMAVILRWGQKLDMIPMFALGGLIAAAIALPFSFEKLAVPANELPALLLWSVLISPVYYTLFVIASRYIQAAELMLAVLVETIEAALLAWIVLSEVPSKNSIVGGVIVIIAVGYLVLVRVNQQSKSR